MMEPSKSSVSSTVFAPVRSSESDVFTSHHAPPPIPSAYLASYRNSSLDSSAPVFRPSTNNGLLTRPPRLSSSSDNIEYVPLFTQAQYSASAWRAVHPDGEKHFLPSLQPRPSTRGLEFSYQSRYSRSSISLTRPTRLSSWSSISQSGSTGSESRDGPFSVGTDEGNRASPREIAYAIMNGTPIPGTERVKSSNRHHTRRASAPNHTASAQQKSDAEFDAVITRKPVPVRRLRSADRARTSNAFTSAQAANDMTTRRPRDLQYLGNITTSAELERRRRTMFEEVKNKPLPKIAIL
jgi:hypothetical protein